MVYEPSLPYVKGAAFEIHPHEPLKPTTMSQVANKRDLEQQGRMTILERCLVHPPLPGKVVEGLSPYSLHVVKQLSVHHGQSAQIVVCEDHRCGSHFINRWPSTEISTFETSFHVVLMPTERPWRI
jgi:hypothetical protein